jgi:hypothetical protein
VHWAQDYALANRELMMRNMIAAVRASGEVPTFIAETVGAEARDVHGAERGPEAPLFHDRDCDRIVRSHTARGDAGCVSVSCRHNYMGKPERAEGPLSIFFMDHFWSNKVFSSRNL